MILFRVPLKPQDGGHYWTESTSPIPNPVAQQYDTLPLSITLRRETYAKLTANLRDVDPGAAIANQVQQFLEHRADGAIMLKTDDIAKIEQAIGKQHIGGKEIVAAAMRSVGLEDGEKVYRFPIDPSFEAPLQEQAGAAGITPEDMIKELVFQCMVNNWVLSLNFEGHSRQFTPAMERWFAKEIGHEHFTVQDIQSLVKDARKAGERELAQAGK